jgi:hypothetical protein
MSESISDDAMRRSATIKVAGFQSRPKTAGWFERAELIEVNVKHSLQSLGGSRGFECLGDSLQPGRIFCLKPDELGDCGTPPLRPAAASGWLRVAGSPCGVAADAQSRCLPRGVPSTVECLALGGGERPITAGLTTAWHDCSPLRDDIQAGGAEAFAGNWSPVTLVPRARAERRR